MNATLIAVVVLTILIVIILVKTAVVVPQKSEYIIERLGNTAGRWVLDFIFCYPFWIACHTNLF